MERGFSRDVAHIPVRAADISRAAATNKTRASSSWLCCNELSVCEPETGEPLQLACTRHCNPPGNPLAAADEAELIAQALAQCGCTVGWIGRWLACPATDDDSVCRASSRRVVLLLGYLVELEQLRFQE